ncbi:hypothetical protein ACVIQT_009995 [Bradyrhizobium diazoefficiens]
MRSSLRPRNSPAPIDRDRAPSPRRVDRDGSETTPIVGVENGPENGRISAEETIPIGVQRDRLAGGRNDHLGVAAAVAVRKLGGIAGNRVKWLMEIPDEVQQPDEVVGPELIGGAGGRGQCSDHDLRHLRGIDRIRCGQARAVRREQYVLIVPIAVLELVVSYVLARSRVADVILPVVALRLDVVGPGRRVDEGIGPSGIVVLRTTRPDLIVGIEPKQAVDLVLDRGIQPLVGQIGDLHMAFVPPRGRRAGHERDEAGQRHQSGFLHARFSAIVQWIRCRPLIAIVTGSEAGDRTRISQEPPAAPRLRQADLWSRKYRPT